MTAIRPDEPGGRQAGHDRVAACPAAQARLHPTDQPTRPRSGTVPTMLLRCVMIIGVAITPVWIGILLWLTYRLGAWLMN